MTNRSQALRARSRKIFAWSLAAGVAVHVAVFALWPRGTELVPTDGRESLLTAVEEDVTWTRVAVAFGPPRILTAGHQAVDEVVERTLEVQRLVPVSPECLGGLRDGARFQALVRLTVGLEGRVESAVLEGEGTSECGDRTTLAVAEDLWYRWLPSRRHPAPVTLIQPVTFAAPG